MDIKPPANQTPTSSTPMEPTPSDEQSVAADAAPVEEAATLVTEPAIQPEEPKKSGSKTALIVISTAVVSALIAGLAVYAWQVNTKSTATSDANAEITALKTENATLTAQNKTLTDQNKALTVQVAKLTAAAPTATPTPTPTATATPKATATPTPKM